MNLLYSVAFISVILCWDPVKGCPDSIGWIPAGDSCYRTSPEIMNWYESQQVIDPCFRILGYFTPLFENNVF